MLKRWLVDSVALNVLLSAPFYNFIPLCGDYCEMETKYWDFLWEIISSENFFSGNNGLEDNRSGDVLEIFRGLEVEDVPINDDEVGLFPDFQ